MTFTIFPCRRCGAIQIARKGQARKRCTACGKSFLLYRTTTVSEEIIETPRGMERRAVSKQVTIPRVKVLREFDTFQEASDAARWAKLPKEMKDPKVTENYQSSAWR